MGQGGNKFGNRKTVVNGVVFDSAKEARRWADLRLLERAGQISDLKRQPRFKLIVNGKLVCSYVADAEYDEAGAHVVEDTKSEITRKHPVYRIKAKLFEAIFGFPVREV